MTPPDYEYLRKLLKDRSGLDLSADKQYLIESRLLPLSRKPGLSDISELVQKMKGGSADLTTQVVEAMTTNETFFFRDKVPFDHFRDSIVPEIVKARASRKSIRIWCAAGSGGQEPYSLAMCLKEMSATLAGWRIEIIATDLSQEVLEKSKAGIYSQFEGTEWYGTIAYAYHDQWWTFNNAHKAVSAIGVHGQYIYLDPVANMVVVKQSSSPDAEGGANESNDTDGPLLYQALAEQLMKR